MKVKALDMPHGFGITLITHEEAELMSLKIQKTNPRELLLCVCRHQLYINGPS